MNCDKYFLKARSLRQVCITIQECIDPMERRLFVTFKGYPEFEGLELQVSDGSINDKGMKVLHYRKDGKVDIYWKQGVQVDRTTFAVVLSKCR